MGPAADVSAERPPEPPDATGEPAAEREPAGDAASIVLDPGKILRLETMVDAIAEELHDEVLDDATRERVRTLYRAIVVEVGSALSDPLLEELAHLQPTGEVSSDDELRVVVAQLAGWLRGLREGLATGDVPFVLEVPVLVEVTTQRPEPDPARRADHGTRADPDAA